MRLQSHMLWRLLFAPTAGKVELTGKSLHLSTRSFGWQLEVDATLSTSVSRGRLGTALTLRRSSDSMVITVGALPGSEVSRLRARILELQLELPLQHALNNAKRMADGTRYLREVDWTNWLDTSSYLLHCIPEDVERLPLDPRLRDVVNWFIQLHRQRHAARAKINRAYVERQLQGYAAWFDTMANYPLTRRQREAVVCGEDNVLVVAGAGTGKTSTIIAKAAFLVHTGQARPDEILLMAFAKKAAEEMQDRLATLHAGRFSVKTFHALGLQILSETEGAKPSLSKLAEDDEALRLRVEHYLAELASDATAAEDFQQFVVRHRYPHRSEFSFKTLHEYARHIAGQSLRTLRGEKVKSFGELRIADYLSTHGIPYTYEADYQVNTATPLRRQYRPDFFLHDHGIYIEYFGTDRHGKTAPYIDQEEYQASMAWKRQTHQANGTRLVELFAYELWEQRLETRLEQQLRAAGVVPQPVDPLQLGQTLKDGGELGRVAGIFCSFLALFKSNRWTFPQLQERVKQLDTVERANAFLRLFQRVLQKYEAELQASSAIDFHDMVARAYTAVETGRYRSPYRFVIVDEFQDISRGRALLLRALLDRQPGRQLFCVGDDWQSIYRFTGSDIGIMTGFRDWFGPTERVDLEQTFRFNDELLQASSRFILQNPQQLKKTLSSPTRLGTPPIHILSEVDGEANRSGVEQALARVQTMAGAAHVSTMLLGRYGFTLPALHDLKQRFRGLDLSARTVHSAKGLEADYVILLDLSAGRYGFPTEVSDDPLLQLVLAHGGDFPNAEERRLFYVAMTRARKHLFLVVPELRRSAFVEELESSVYATWVEGDPGRPPVYCPSCGGGRLRLIRTGPYGVFWGCSNFPLCTATAKSCPRCSVGALVRRGSYYACSQPGCEESIEACPSCKDGMLVQRHSRFGPFLSCSNWRPEGHSCGYKRDLRRRRG